MSKLILDSGPLITTCKFSVQDLLLIDHLLRRCEIIVADSVRDEVVVAGVQYRDAHAARQRIERGQIAVLSPPAVPDLGIVLGLYELGHGERDSILLTEHASLVDATLVLDDHLAYLVSDRLRRRKRFLLDVIVDLVRAEQLAVELAVDMVSAIGTRYPSAFVEHTMLLLRR
ncbi:MAG: hypothetical protein ACK2VD_02075 [Anaerolineae bacterium]|jgi:hypothetical protein